jgi:hypothetical protein
MENLVRLIEDDNVKGEYIGAVMNHANTVFMSFSAESQRRKLVKEKQKKTEGQEDKGGSSKAGTLGGSVRNMFKRMAEGPQQPCGEKMQDKRDPHGSFPVPSPPWSTVYRSG